MAMPILATELYIPPPQPKVVLGSHQIERLNEGMHYKLTPSLPPPALVKQRWSANKCKLRVAGRLIGYQSWN